MLKEQGVAYCKKLPLTGDQILLAGVIDTLTNVIEHPETVAERLERVAAVIGDPRRVIANTDCGLETSAGGSAVASDVAWAKLASVAEGARIASRRLFRQAYHAPWHAAGPGTKPISRQGRSR